MPPDDQKVRPSDEIALASLFRTGNVNRTGTELGLQKLMGAKDARGGLNAILRKRTVQEYFFEMMDEADLHLVDVLKELRRIIFEAEMRVYDFKTGEVVTLGPDNHERNRGIELVLRGLGVMANSKPEKVGKTKIVMQFGAQPLRQPDPIEAAIDVTPGDATPLTVTPDDVLDALRDMIHEDDDDDGD